MMLTLLESFTTRSARDPLPIIAQKLAQEVIAGFTLYSDVSKKVHHLNLVDTRCRLWRHLPSATRGRRILPDADFRWEGIGFITCASYNALLALLRFKPTYSFAPMYKRTWQPGWGVYQERHMKLLAMCFGFFQTPPRENLWPTVNMKVQILVGNSQIAVTWKLLLYPTIY